MGKLVEYFLKRRLGSIKWAKKIGVTVGENCNFVDYPNFGSEPYLISIGSHVMLSFDITFITHDASTFVFRETEKYKNLYKFGPISIGDNCFIGAKTIILPNVVIGNNCIVGAGSLVTKNIPAGEVWAGVPARKISSTEAYAEKCFMNKLPYDDDLINSNKRQEMIRVCGIVNQ